MKRNLIVGAGITGATVARILSQSESVLVIDRRNHIGGNVYDYKDSGITVHKYGPHAFHTNNQEVWEFLSKYTDWHPFELRIKVVINGKPVTLPFNLKTIHEVFDEGDAKRYEKKLVSTFEQEKKIPILDLMKSDDDDLKLLADFVYENVFKNYTIKQWGITPEEIDPSVMARVPVLVSYDDRYFQDRFQGIPKNGYTKMIENMLGNQNIETRLNTDFKDLNEKFDRIIYTGAIDEFFDYKYGKLPYRSLRFDIQTFDKEYFQATAITNYPNDHDYTRITEHKHFLNEKTSKTIVSYEYPQAFEEGKNERYYPINNAESSILYTKYLEESKKLGNVYFVGRLGDYKYYNMDQAVARGIEFCKNL